MPFPSHDDTPLTEVFPVTDTALLRAAAGRVAGIDMDAVWRALIDAYAAPIERTLARHLGGVEDTTVRAFFGYLYERAVLERFDRARRPFRCFIQGAARNFAREQRREARGLPTLGDDFDLTQEGSDEGDASEWASAVLSQAFAVLRAERPRDARVLEGHHGLNDAPRLTHAALASELNSTPGAIAVAVHHAHRRLGELLRAQLRYHCPRSAQSDDAALSSELSLILEHLRAARPTLTFERS